MLFEVQTKTFCGFGITKDILPKLVIDPVVVIAAEPHLHALPYEAYEIPEGEPTYKNLETLTWHIRNKPEIGTIIGIGGGSVMDSAKALAILYTNFGKPLDYRGFDKVVNPGLPTILIPTTAGTGSEITPNAVFTDTDEKRKLGINGRHMRATYAILDAEWTLSCPYSVALSSLLDAFVHAVESYMAPEATPLTRALSREAFRLLYQNALSIKVLPHKPRHSIAGSDTNSLQALLYGAYLAAMALSNSGSGVVGAMSYPLGVHFGIPHGYAGGIFLPDIIEHNVKKGYDFSGLNPEYWRGMSVPPDPSAYRFVYMIGDLWKRLEVPNLKQWIKPTDVLPMPFMTNEALAKNPVPIQLADVQNFVARHV